ncbi:response regulator [bacterium]|nr:response regulator [bacterium]
MSLQSKILIVDDEPGFRKLILKAISRENPECEFEEAEDGENALKKLTSENFNTVILDVNMPVMDGFEVLKSIRDNEKIADLPVIMCTGSNDRDEVMKIIGMGVSGYIVKSTDTDSMTQKLLGLLEKINKNTSNSGIKQDSIEIERIVKALNAKMVVADEDIAFRKQVNSVFRKYYSIVEVENVKVLYDTCFKQKPDIIILGRTSDTYDSKVVMPKLSHIARENDMVIVRVFPNKKFLDIFKKENNDQHAAGITRTMNSELLESQLREIITIPGFLFSIEGRTIRVELRNGCPEDEKSVNKLKQRIITGTENGIKNVCFDLSDWKPDSNDPETGDAENRLAELVESIKESCSGILIEGMTFADTSPLSKYILKDAENEKS